MQSAGGSRRVWVGSQDVRCARFEMVIALATTSQPQAAGFALTLELACANLPKRSWVKISQIRTLSVEWLGQKINLFSPEQLGEIVEGLSEMIGQ